MIDLAPALKKYTEERDKPNEVGRYSCSQIYSYLNGWCSPTDFLKGEEKDFAQCFRMWQGTSKHKQVEDLMKVIGYETEVKKEMKVEPITIVGIADYLSDGEVADLKTSMELYKVAKKWHLYQVKLYCTLFEKPIGKIVQPVYKTKSVFKRGKTKLEPDKFYLKELGSVKRDDKWFNEQMDLLLKFHNKILKVVKSLKPKL